MKRRLPSLTALRSFEAVARNRSFTKAAEELGVTQAAVSHQIRALEEYINEKLFDRIGHAITLTKRGDALFTATRESLDYICDTIAEMASDTDRARRTIAVGAETFLSTYWLGPRLPEFTARYPDVDYLLVSTNQPTGVSGGSLNSVADSAVGRKRGRQYPLFRSALAPLCSPQLAQKLGAPPKLDELPNQVLICKHYGDEWQEWLRVFGPEQLASARRYYFSDANLIVEAALGGHGIMLAPPRLLEQWIDSGRLVMPFAPSQVLYIDHHLVASDTPTDRKIAAFRVWVMDEAARFLAGASPRLKWTCRAVEATASSSVMTHSHRYGPGARPLPVLSSTVAASVVLSSSSAWSDLISA